MVKSIKAVQTPLGRIEIRRADASWVTVYLSGPSVSVDMRLTLEQAQEFGEALVHGASEEFHPDACPVCGGIGGTAGCQCDPAPVKWAVFKRLRQSPEAQPVLMYYVKDQAEGEQHVRDRCQYGKDHRDYTWLFFTAPVKTEEDTWTEEPLVRWQVFELGDDGEGLAERVVLEEDSYAKAWEQCGILRRTRPNRFDFDVRPLLMEPDHAQG